MGEHAAHNFRKNVELVEEYDEHGAVLFGLHELELRFCPECERALRAADELGEIEGACFFVAYAPQAVSGGVFRNFGAVLFDELGVFSEECVHFAVDVALEGFKLFLFGKFGVREWPESGLRAVGKDDIHFFDIALGLAVFECALAAGVIGNDAAERSYAARGGVGREDQVFLERLFFEVAVVDAGLGHGVVVAHFEHVVHVLGE